MSNQELTQKVLSLPLTDRVELAQALWESIDEGAAADAVAAADTADTATEVREAVDLARKRDRDLATGRVAGRTHQQVMEAARRALE